MEIKLAKRTEQIQPSVTLALNARAAELKTQGKDVISLSVGEPDFDTPEHIKEAAIQAIHAGKTKYTAADGLPSLKKAIIEKLSRDNHLDYQPDQIIVSNGAKHSIHNLCNAFLNPGDEVIIPAPYWVTYPELVKLAEAKPVILDAPIEQQYKITPAQLENAITDKTRLFFINSPSNPTGIAYTADELKALADVLLKYPDIFIMTDDIYEHILWNHTPFQNILNVCPELYERTIIINGVSKAYAMTGWRIGYAAGPTPIIKTMKKIQSQATGNPSSISQAAAEIALKEAQTCVTDMVKKFKARHELVFNKLKTIKGVQVLPSDGTFYSFPNVQHIIDNHPHVNNDVELSEYLLNEAEVALVPGAAFGSPGCIRISFAAHEDILIEALDRIQKVI